MRQNVAPPVTGSDPSPPEARQADAALAEAAPASSRARETARTASEGQDSTAAMLSDAIGLIARRLDDIERKITDTPQPVNAPAEVERSAAQAERPSEGERDGAHNPHIEAALRGVEERISQVSDRIAQGGQRGAGRAKLDGRFELNSAIEEIRSRQSELEDGSSARRGPAARPHTELLRSLRDDFSRLSGQLDTGRHAPDGADGAVSLRGEIGGLRQSIGELATRQEVGALERAVRELAAKVAEAPPSERDLAGFAGPLANLHAEMQSLSRLVAADAKGRAALDLEALSRKLDAIAQTGVKSPTVEMLSRELGEVRALLKEIADPHRVRNLAEQVAGLNHQVAQVRRQFGNSDLSELTGAINEIRTAVATREPSDSRQGEAVARELERLSARVETALAAGAPTSTEQHSRIADELGRLSVRVEEAVHAADHPAGLEQHNRAVARELDRLSGRIDGALVAAKNPAGIDVLMERLDRLDETLGRPRPAGELKPIEDMLSALADKLDQAERPGGDLDGLEQQVALLSERLERSSPEPALASLERSMGDLLAQMESLRSGTAEAAERAVKAAVVSTLEAMPLGGPEIDSLKEELADLKASQDEAGKWTQDTFSAVHVTLDKVVSRLATLDLDVAAERPATPAPSVSLPEPKPAAATAPEPSAPTPPAAKQLEDSLKLLEAELVPQSPDSADLDSALEVTKPKEILLEPGEARPRRDVLHAANQPGPGADPADIKASFIAAARRAAQAASDEAAAGGKEKGAARRLKSTQYADLGRDGGHGAKRAKQRLDDRRRPILLGLAAVVLALGALQVGGTYYGQSTKTATVAAPPRTEAKLAPAPSAPSPSRETAAASNTASDSLDPRTTAGLPSGPVGQPEEPSPQPVEASSGARQDRESKSVARLDLSKPGGRLDGSDAAPAPTAPAAPPPNASAAPPLERISNMASIGQIPANAGPPGLRQAALAGDPVAVYELASRAAEGRGMPRDLALAARLYEKAAGHGLVPAQYRTGNLYEKGLGVSRDLVVAKSWYQRAADKGNARAMHNLAVLIAEGVGGKPDYGSAIGWFRRAAQYGVRDSQFNLAVLLARGLGTQQDLSGSYTWFAIVATQGDEDAGKKRDEVAARLSPAELTAAKLAAERWRPDTPDKAANEVAVPPQGWAESPAPAKRAAPNGKV